MYSITDLRKDVLIQLNNIPYKVTEYSHTKMGIGGATVRIKIKSLVDGSVLEKAFKNDEKIEPANVERKKTQFLYTDSGKIFLMDVEDYQTLEVNLDENSDFVSLFKPGDIVDSYVFNDNIVAFEYPKNVILKVTEAFDATKGTPVVMLLKKLP